MDLSWHASNSTNTLYHTEKQGFGYLWISKKKKNSDTPTKTR